MSNRLKELRHKNNLTLKELGKKVSMLDSTLSQYENEKRNPSIAVWEKLASFYKVSVDYLQNKYYCTEDLIKIVHNMYFHPLHRMKVITDEFGYFDFNSISQVNEIDLFISMTSKDTLLPTELYQNNTKEFPLTNKVKDYWKKWLGPIFAVLESYGIPSNTSEVTVFNLILDTIKEAIKILEKKQTTSDLGAAFAQYIGDEHLLHQEVFDSIKFADIRIAKEKINIYSDYINILKDKINKFDVDEYFSSLIEKTRKEKNKNNAEDNKRNKIIDEIVERVSNGNVKLRSYIIKYIDEYVDITDAYDDFKRLENGKQTKLSKLESIDLSNKHKGSK